VRRQYIFIVVIGTLGLCLLTVLVYNLPPIHDRLGWRVDSLRVQVKRFFNPPEQVLFVPQEQVDAIVNATLTAMAPTSAPTSLPALTETPSPTPVPSPTWAPVPASITLNGIRHEYQQFNNCAPSSLSMVLSYWGWTGDQYVTRAYLRPNFETDDKNVNPYEIVDYVKKQTQFDAVWRVGGDMDTLKRLLAAGFPVLIEKGMDDPHDHSWLGHYLILSGYEDAKGQFLVYDSYEGPPEAYGVPYDTIGQFWRHFNFVYLVIFPPERAAEVTALLGANSDPQVNYRNAANLAFAETATLPGREQFFAWFNLGTNLIYLQDYANAATAYDNAFSLYAALPEQERPWRLLWYQDGPYNAYYHTGRYQDVINLAHSTLVNVDKPVLEETYYWRGMAKEAMGDRQGAVEDLTRASILNPNSTPAGVELQKISGAGG
jgi:tetratricopeptide (TPR) repeat protein